LPIGAPAPDQVEEAVVQFVQRVEHRDGKVGLGRPAADDCVLHNGLLDTLDSKERISEVATHFSANAAAIACTTTGVHPNFVINFCQILFDAETA
jgi:hypothetical protein